MAPAFASLLQMAATRMGPCPEYFSLWPVAQVAEPWATLRKAAFQAVRPDSAEFPVMYWLSALLELHQVHKTSHGNRELRLTYC